MGITEDSGDIRMTRRLCTRCDSLHKPSEGYAQPAVEVWQVDTVYTPECVGLGAAPGWQPAPREWPRSVAGVARTQPRRMAVTGTCTTSTAAQLTNPSCGGFFNEGAGTHNSWVLNGGLGH